jgi:hypothetical protein
MRMTRQIQLTGMIWLLLAVFLCLTEPNGLPVVALIVPFVLLFAALYGSWSLLQRFSVKYLARGRPHTKLGVVLCIGAVLLLVLQSLGQLSLRDIVMVAAIVAVGSVYATRSGFLLPER